MATAENILGLSCSPVSRKWKNAYIKVLKENEDGIRRYEEDVTAPVAICEDCFVNFPAHMLEEVEAILKSSEDIEDIKAGKVGFIIEPYTTDEGNTCYGIRWSDID